MKAVDLSEFSASWPSREFSEVTERTVSYTTLWDTIY
jgi:hypothetical protein